MNLVERLRNIQNAKPEPALNNTFLVTSELWNQIVDQSLDAADENAHLREQLGQVRQTANAGHTAAYDLRNDILAILDQPEEKP